MAMMPISATNRLKGGLLVNFSMVFYWFGFSLSPLGNSTCQQFSLVTRAIVVSLKARNCASVWAIRGN
jgi:hypothetical protein